MTTVLTLPGWQGSGSAHWQSRWEVLHGCVRVEQQDWMEPHRDTWVTALDTAVSAIEGPVVLVAHSLGCVLAAHWAAHASAHDMSRVARIRGALLVAVPDVDRVTAPAQVRNFGPLPNVPLPFPAVAIASTSDPYCSFLRAGLIASAWGADFVNAGNAGHLNAESGLGDWLDGWAHVRPWLE